MSAIVDMTGQKIGRLTVLGPAGFKRRLAAWRCLCECGKETVVAGGHLRGRRGTRSCGCYASDRRREAATTHGLSGTPEHGIWTDMIQRCTNPRRECFRNYGGRGIRVAAEWLGEGGFERFFAHVGPRSTPEHEIDRIDNDGHYEPGNVRWATRSEQSSNTRRNRRLTFRGETLTLAAWSRRTGIPAAVIRLRVLWGWSMERALTEPSRPGRRRAALAPRGEQLPLRLAS